MSVGRGGFVGWAGRGVNLRSPPPPSETLTSVDGPPVAGVGCTESMVRCWPACLCAMNHHNHTIRRIRHACGVSQSASERHPDWKRGALLHALMPSLREAQVFRPVPPQHSPRSDPEHRMAGVEDQRSVDEVGGGWTRELHRDGVPQARARGGGGRQRALHRGSVEAGAVAPCCTGGRRSRTSSQQSAAGPGEICQPTAHAAVQWWRLHDGTRDGCWAAHRRSRAR